MFIFNYYFNAMVSGDNNFQEYIEDIVKYNLMTPLPIQSGNACICQWTESPIMEIMVCHLRRLATPTVLLIYCQLHNTKYSSLKNNLRLPPAKVSYFILPSRFTNGSQTPIPDWYSATLIAWVDRSALFDWLAVFSGVPYFTFISTRCLWDLCTIILCIFTLLWWSPRSCKMPNSNIEAMLIITMSIIVL